ncbi:Putative RNA recognition motif domain, nucleotide-binding alpha-beta plait domain superfamily [Septoria linicola]|uniref:RNA recognition motif domain, nucleotide-binding alpha-beta plait domain superfamily n=1 Tax=Septoria linicola TaxID=215465 RepID=A0A9Q9B4L1_9PEZI|nr:Putative RNA recognition motif domain, nucleotide-binding alpha-beta plait domain superfamily [Septoria linicola]
MSGNLDKSLDAIMKDQKDRPAGGRRGGRAGRLPARKAAAKSKAATTAVIAPAGGIAKKTKGAKPPKGPAAAILTPSGESKISVSGLPEDVTEALIKDYFSASVGPVKKVILNYGPTGRSRGSATVVFSKSTGGAEAVKLDGTIVDGKKMRIEVIMGAKTLPPAQAPKPLSERVAKQPKSAAKEKPKQAGATKGQAATKGAAASEKSKKPKSGRAGRAKAKTAEELDAEMQDYFGSGDAAATTNGAAPAAPATNGADTGMVDEVM